MRKVAVIICSVFITFFFVAGSVVSAASSKAKSDNSVQKISKKHKSQKNSHNLKSASSKSREVRSDSSERKLSSKKARKTTKVKKHLSKTKTAKNRILPIQQEVAENDEYIEYKLRHGEDLTNVAEKFNIDYQEIVDLNKTITKSLRPGSIVFIPKTQEELDDAPIVLNDKLSKPWKSEEERGILVKVAKSFAGAPYRYGGDSVRGLDCSAFVRKMYNIFGVDLPRSAKEQYCAGPRVNKEDLITGDLVFFKTKRLAKHPTHVGIYIGNDMFIHASSTLKRGVQVDKLTDNYFDRTYTGAVRLKAPPQTERSDTETGIQKDSDKS